MNAEISILTSFAAGLFSFVSPCVLPLLSSYFMFIAGAAADGANTAGAAASRRRLAGLTVFFVLGFSFVFVLLSVLFYGVFNFFGGGFRQALNIAAGAAVILFGANMIFNFIPFLKFNSGAEGQCETCAPPQSRYTAKKSSIFDSLRKPLQNPPLKPRGFFGALFVGIAFGVGWTPCVSAFLGSILMLAGQSATLASGIIYLSAYSAGLGLPFIVTGMFWGSIAGALRRFRRVMPVLRIASGIFLIAIGLVILCGKSFALSAWLQRL